MEASFSSGDFVQDTGLPKPVLSMYRADGSDLTLFNKLKGDATWFQIRSTEHDSFNTDYWQLTSATLDRQREAARTITDYSLWFLNKYLKGTTEPMPQPANYPQVFNFKQK